MFFKKEAIEIFEISPGLLLSISLFMEEKESIEPVTAAIIKKIVEPIARLRWLYLQNDSII